MYLIDDVIDCTIVAILGATIIPNLASSLGSLGIIAATGALSGVFGFLGYVTIGLMLHFLLEEKDTKNNPIIIGLTKVAVAGAFIAGAYLACMIMGQAFVPFLICSAVGWVVTQLAFACLLGLLRNCVKEPEPVQYIGMDMM